MANKQKTVSAVRALANWFGCDIRVVRFAIAKAGLPVRPFYSAPQINVISSIIFN